MARLLIDGQTYPARRPVGTAVALQRIAQVHGRKRSTICGERVRTWAETADRVACLASALRAMGVGPGDRVAALGLASDRYFELLAAVPWAGGVVVPLNWRWTVPELAFAIGDCTPTLLVFDAHHAATARALASSRPEMRLAALDPGLGEAPFVDDLVARHPPVDDAGRGGDDPFQLAYTGGTTGRSKAVVLSHRNVLVHALTSQAEGLLGEDCIYLVSGPLFHAAGMWPCMALQVSGGTAVLPPAFEPRQAMALIEAHRVTETLFVPTMLHMVLDHPEFGAFDLSSLRLATHGGSPTTKALLTRAFAALPRCQFVQIYGMTELSPLCATLPDGNQRGLPGFADKLGATGRALKGMEVRVVGPDDRPLPPGEVGEIVCRSEAMMLGYWQRPKETEEALRNGWMHTGDGGYMDEEGFLYVVDRVKDMIVTGGENVFSTEVENALATHPAVNEVVVIGIPSQLYGEQVHAIVRLKDGAQFDEEGLIAHCRTLIAGYKVPRSIALRDEPFPLTPANKILKRELRRPYWEGHDNRLV